MVGNPNTGKTTLFNRLTGANARVGNYPGITVERAVGQARLPSGPVDVLDVPGCYSVVARRRDEQIAIDCLLGRGGNPSPDLIVAVADATNLGRNLYFLLQLVELERPLVIALNMSDAAAQAGIVIDVDHLSELLGVPVVPISAAKGEGIELLRQTVSDALSKPRRPVGWLWQPSPGLAADLAALAVHLDEIVPAETSEGARLAAALWALMSIDTDDELVGVSGALRLAVLARQRQARDDGRDIDGEVVGARYGWIDAHSDALITRGPAKGPNWTDRVDGVLLHPVAGFGLFIALMLLVFQALFAWSGPAIDLIDWGIQGLGGMAQSVLPAGVLSDFVADALIGGVGGVLVFLPQIMLLFFFIALMEDTGYMARAAFLMDRIMNRIGLHGRAFVPMVSGFACAVPAVMATRSMERKRDRFLTMMVLPLTTCSARLPVYTLIIAALIPSATGPLGLNQQSWVMIGMYFFSIIITLLAAAVLGRTVLKGERVPLLLELPPYRRPSARGVWRMVAGRSKVFLREAGRIILVCSILLWALLYFPRSNDEVVALQAQQAQIVSTDTAALSTMRHAIDGAQKRGSFAGRLGHFIEPVIRPLGYDWKIGVGLIGAFAAREVFVSTMGVVYGLGGDVDETSTALHERMHDERHKDGSFVYTPLVGFSLLIFFALACQCMSTLAAVKRETMSYRWPAFMFAYMTSLAWLSAFAVYQGGRMLGFG